MEFNNVSSTQDYRAAEIFSSYCNAFPEDERRCERQFNELFDNNKVKIVSILNGLQNVGYMICWELSNFVFVEHFEIFSEFRSQKFGTESIRELFKNYSKIVLEAEPEFLDEISKNRVAFYKKNGFTVIDENYLQPAYENGKNPVPLWLLANFSPDKTDLLRDEIYDVVYCK